MMKPRPKESTDFSKVAWLIAEPEFDGNSAQSSTVF